jgi:hypothetical protein
MIANRRHCCFDDADLAGSERHGGRI